RVAASAVTRGAGDGEVVFAVERDVGSGNGGAAGTGKRGDAHVHIAQAAGRTLHHNLRVHGLAARAGQTDGGSCARGVRFSHTEQTWRYPNTECWWRNAIHGEGGGVAGRTSSRVADRHCELLSIVGTRRRWRGIGRSGRTADGRSILPPLIAQGSGACGSDAKRSALTRGDRLACRLRRDRRRYRGSI